MDLSFTLFLSLSLSSSLLLSPFLSLSHPCANRFIFRQAIASVFLYAETKTNDRN